MFPVDTNLIRAIRREPTSREASRWWRADLPQTRRSAGERGEELAQMAMVLLVGFIVLFLGFAGLIMFMEV